MITILKRPLLLKYSLFVVLGFALMVFFLVIVAGFSEGETITVDDDGEGEYTKIQDAIDAATEGDEIRVWAGTYEENVVVDKTLSLIGNGSEETTIDGGGVDDVVSIEAAWCNVSGFTITKSGLSLSYAGIDISSHNNMVSNNAIVANRNDGIRLDQSDYNMFSNNNISDNWGEGVYMSQSDHNNFSNNIVSDNDDKGIFFSGHYNTFSDNNVSNNDDDGIRLVSSTYNRFSNNSVLDNRYHGIYIYTNSNYNTLSNSSISRNRRNGVYLERAYHNTLSNNSISNNSFLSNEYRDLLLKDSRYSTLSSNEIRGDGISIAGDLEHWNTHSIDSLNTVNGKPLYYYANSKDLTVPQGAGQVILANCSFMTVENQNCSNAEIGINVAFSSHITISDNSIWGSRSAGIRLYESHNCTLSGNSVSGGVDGIYLYESPDNELFGNTVTDGKRGINIRWFSHRNTLSDNKVSGNEGGILVWGDYNNFTDNSITENSDYGIKLGSGTASHCRLSGNTISNNDQGITLEGASSNDNEITNGTISNNRIGIRLTDGAQDNRVRDNTISGNSEYGIDASGNDGYSIDARNNWWGDRSGPYHETGNPDGKGNEVTDDVEFDPWLKSVPFNGLYVDDDAPDGGDGSWEKPYNKIQDAIDAAEDGIIIKVWAGTYEENVVVDKTVSLIGNGSEDVIIDGGRIDSVMKITADWVNVTGFCTQNSLGGDYAGIYILSNHTMISHNRCTENYAGISLVNSGHNTIANNICESNNQYAINLRSSHNTTLINNICQDQ